MSRSYERETAGEAVIESGIIRFPNSDTVQFAAVLDVENITTRTSNLNALTTNVGHNTAALLHIENVNSAQTTRLDGQAGDINGLRSQIVSGLSSAGSSLSAVETTVGQHTTTLSAHTSDISLLNAKTVNQSAVGGTSTTFTGDVTAARFMRNGGLANQFLMADGSVLEQSSLSQGANIYLYKTITEESTSFLSPNAGEVRFDSPASASTQNVYINTMTRDGVDIAPFLNLVNTLSLLYIQEQGVSTNYVVYKVTHTPAVSSPSVIRIQVTRDAHEGTGKDNIGNDVNAIVSFFTDDVEIDSRITTVEGKVDTVEGKVDTLETKTFALSKQDAGSGMFGAPAETRMGSIFNMMDHRIVRLGDPDEDDDAISKSYADGRYAGKAGLGAFVKDGIGDFFGFVEGDTEEAQIASLAAAVAALTVAGAAIVTTTSIGGIIDNRLNASTIVRTGAVVVGQEGNDSVSNRTMKADLYFGAAEDAPEDFWSIKNIKDVTASGTITADKFVKKGGGSRDEFLKSDGTYDDKAYIATTDGVFSDLTNAVADIEDKTQNITSIEGTTTVEGGLVCESYVKNVNWKKTGTFRNAGFPQSNSYTYGAEFTLLKDFGVTDVYVPAVLYNVAGPLNFRFWRKNINDPAYQTIGPVYAIPKTNLIGDAYTYSIPAVLPLAPGTYRYGVQLPPHDGNDYYTNIGQYPTFTFDPLVIGPGVIGVWSGGSGSSPVGLQLPSSQISLDPATGGFYGNVLEPSRLTSDKFVVTGGGQSSEFLKSNGTVDSSVYITATSTPFTNLQASVALKLDTPVAPYATQADVSLKLDTSLANSTFATQTSVSSLQTKTTALSYAANTTTLTGALSLSNGSANEFLMANGSTNVTTYLLASDRGNFSLAGQQYNISGTGTVNAFSQGQSLELVVRGSINFTDDNKQTETITPLLFINNTQAYAPGAIAMPSGSFTGGNFMFRFEVAFCSSSNYHCNFTHTISDNTRVVVSHGTHVGALTSFPYIFPIGVDARMTIGTTGTSSISILVNFARIRVYR